MKEETDLVFKRNGFNLMEVFLMVNQVIQWVTKLMIILDLFKLSRS